jgi:hypothetical protein
MCLKTETLVDTDSIAIIRKDIQDDESEALFEQSCNQCGGNGHCISLSTGFWCSQYVAEYGNVV